RDHRGQLVKVGFAEVDLAVAVPGVHALRAAGDMDKAEDFAGWRLVMRSKLAGNFGKVGVGQGRLKVEGVAVGQGNDAVQREQAGHSASGDLARSALSRIAIREGSKEELPAVAPEWTLGASKLDAADHRGVDLQLAAGENAFGS